MKARAALYVRGKSHASPSSWRSLGKGPLSTQHYKSVYTLWHFTRQFNTAHMTLIKAVHCDGGRKTAPLGFAVSKAIDMLGTVISAMHGCSLLRCSWQTRQICARRSKVYHLAKDTGQYPRGNLSLDCVSPLSSITLLLNSSTSNPA